MKMFCFLKSSYFLIRTHRTPKHACLPKAFKTEALSVTRGQTSVKKYGRPLPLRRHSNPSPPPPSTPGTCNQHKSRCFNEKSVKQFSWMLPCGYSEDILGETSACVRGRCEIFLFLFNFCQVAFLM